MKRPKTEERLFIDESGEIIGLEIYLPYPLLF